MTGNHGYGDGQDDFPVDVRVPAPARRKRKRRIVGLVNGLLSICLLMVFAAAGAYIYVVTSLDSAGPLETERAVVVKRGQGGREIAEMLAREGAISNDKIFLIGLMINDAKSKLKAGEYAIEPHASMRQIMDKLVAGKSIQYKITIPEGLTTTQILARIAEQDLLDGEIVKAIPEGSLLPDTYAFTRGTSRQEIVDRMRSAQTRLMEQAWPSRNPKLPLATPYEALILASIVEKETAVSSERPQVASVFVNRLKQRMRLQSDPTIIYGLVGGKGTLGRPILKSDLAKQTPYNTYQIDGLPPTPIANPGKAAIEAVLNPAATRYLFFVADGTGGHAFAASLDEHNRNVSRWRQIEAQRRQDETATQQADLTASEPSPEVSLQVPEADPPVDTTPLDEALPAAEQAVTATEQAVAEPAEPAPAEPAVAVPAEPVTAPEPEAPAVPAAQEVELPTPDAQQVVNVEPEQPILPSEDPTGTVPSETVAAAPSTQASEPVPVPKPKPAPISDTARAILLNVPLPKPKPPVPRQGTDDSAPQVDDTVEPSVTLTPLPDTPPVVQATPPEPTPTVTQAPPQPVPNTDLR